MRNIIRKPLSTPNRRVLDRGWSAGFVPMKYAMCSSCPANRDCYDGSSNNPRYEQFECHEEREETECDHQGHCEYCAKKAVALEEAHTYLDSVGY